MTTTTERPRYDLRLHLIALLASVYVLAWWAFGGRVPTRGNDSEQVPTWYQDLPPSARPSVQLPPGWHIAEATTPAAVPARAVQVPARVPRARPARVRTRSS